jgi:aspartate/methionine/tyrosine aminotransferase
MNYEQFLSVRADVRRTRRPLHDLSEINLYRSLAPHFAAIAPSSHSESPYRCHIAERFLARARIDVELKSRALVSHGVRRSLGALFALLARRGARVGIPDDVYPTYLELASAAEVQVTTYSARAGLPASLQGIDALLVCEPLKPWGTTLTKSDVEALTQWVAAAPERMLIVDSAYSLPATTQAMTLLDRGVAVLLLSLSKGWLIPDHVGLCVVPERWQNQAREVFSQLPKDTERLRIGYAALTEHFDRVEGVQAHIAHRARRLDVFTEARPELQATRCTGYFAVAQRAFEDLLDQDVLAVPASVFGGPKSWSLLSSLEVADRDRRK